MVEHMYPHEDHVLVNTEDAKNLGLENEDEVILLLKMNHVILKFLQTMK